MILYLRCCFQSLFQCPRFLLWWPGSRGWNWHHGCWCHSGCLWRRPKLHWCWLQLHFACCLLGYPRTSVVGSAKQKSAKLISFTPALCLICVEKQKSFVQYMSIFSTLPTAIYSVYSVCTYLIVKVQFARANLSQNIYLWGLWTNGCVLVN